MTRLIQGFGLKEKPLEVSFFEAQEALIGLKAEILNLKDRHLQSSGVTRKRKVPSFVKGLE